MSFVFPGRRRNMTKMRIWRKPSSLSIVFIVLGTIILLFLFIPLLKTMFSCSPQTLWDTLLKQEVYSSILLTIYAALIATLLGLFLGVPLAYILARYEFRGKRFLEGFIDVPIVVPHTAAGVALLFVFGSNFVLGGLLNGVGLGFARSVTGIVFAMMFVSVPFLIDSAKEGFKSVDVRMEKVARTLGASPWSSFFRVSLPLAWRSIFSGSVLMWARGFSEFGAVYIISYWVDFFGWRTMAAPVLVSHLFYQPGGWNAVLPVVVLLILIAFIAFGLARSVAYKR
jgi:molybdate/tungstate transport system permease protein